MRVLATSDLHGNLDNLDLQQADLVIIAGDFAKLNGFSKWNLYDQKKWIQQRFIPFINDNKRSQFVIIPGNHDLIFDQEKIFQIHDVDLRISWPDNAHLLINQGIDLLGLKIYGTPNVPIISYMWAFESDHQSLKEEFSKIPYDLDILISHSPPHLGNDLPVDCSLQNSYYEFFGSSELAEELLEKKPRYVFCGHIHSGLHEQVDFCESKIYNVSRVDEGYQIAYDPLVLEIEPRRS